MKKSPTQFFPPRLRRAHALMLALAMWLLPVLGFGQNRIIIDGTDANDHGSASGGVNLDGWRYMQKALEALAPQVANGKKVVVDLGTKTSTQARNASTSAFSLSNLPAAGWTIVYINGTTDIATFLDGGTVGGITVNDVGLLYIPTASNSLGDLSTTEIAVINARAASVANLVNNLGVALFAMGEEGTGRWGWLTSLISTVTPVAASATGLTLTADGQAAFPGLTSADLSTGPWHNYFTGNFGSLRVLATETAGRAVILGGVGVASSSFQFSAASVSAGEAASPLVVAVTRTGITTAAQTVEFFVSGGTAARGPDYTLADGALSFAAGETQKNISIAITGDALDEADETIVLTLRNASVGAAIGVPGATTITVVDDDPTPTLTIADVTITETLSGTSVATFPVQLSAPSGRSVTVNFATANGTALAPADYAAQSGTLTFNPGETSKTIGVVINGDVVPEQTENFTVTLTAPANASLARAVATGSIVNAAADLRVESFVVQPLPSFFGQTVSVTWTIRNAGNVPAAPGWDDRLFLATTTAPTAADLVLLTRSTSDLAALGAGGTYTRQQNVTLPFGAALVAGEYYVVLVADSGSVLSESDETNNSAATARGPVALPPDLQISDVLPTSDVTAGEAIQIRWKVRNSGLGSAVGTWSDRVIVRNLTANRVLLDTLVPFATGPIAPGGTLDRQLAFTVPVGNDGLGQFEISVAADSANVVFEQNATATAEANNTTAVTLTSNGPRALTLALGQPTIIEGASLGGTVSIPVALASPLTVTLGVSQANRLTFPATVIIPAGQTSATFTVQAVQNANVDAALDLTLIASAPAHIAATFALRILDDDAPAITFTLDRNLVSESAGNAALIGTLTLDRAVATGLVADFTVAPAGQIVIPSALAIPANALTFPVSIGVLNNGLADGNRTVTITARLAPVAGGVAIATAVPVAFTITDDEGASLSLAFDRSLFVEGRNPAGNGIVTRSPAGGGALTVSLVSADPATLVVPASVTIPAGQASATFPVQTPGNAQPNGNRSVAVMASAAGYNAGSASAIVTDLQKPDLTVALIEPPTGAQTEAWIDVRVLTTNNGATAAPGPFAQRILLSSDTAIGGDTLLSQSNFTGVIPPGSFIEQSLRVKLPRDAGRYWLVAETDAGAVVDEALENNNAAISSVPLDLAPAYSATLTIVPASVPAGTAIPITGSATLAGGAPAAFMLVNIHITSPGAKRIISALTNSLGQFDASFTPMPGEGGLFQFGAAHPGVATASVQDEVQVFGLRAEPGSLDLALSEQASQTGTVLIRNLADVPISGLAASVSGLPVGVQFIPALSATTVPAGGTVSLDYTVSTQGPLDRSTFNVALTSAPGATLTIPVAITVAALQPRLVAAPGSLESGMLRGQQLLLNFELRNDGGAPTGPINLLLPTSLTWMRLTSPLPLAPLAPGESVTVTLQLLPPVDLPLEEFSGRFIAREGTRSLAIPFTFRSLSNRTGSFTVRAEDEFTYYAQGNPPLAGATVAIIDSLTQQTVATATTDASGTVSFPNLREGYYAIEATADRHTRFRATRFLSPGIDNQVRAFLSRQTVTYNWTVNPTTIEDRYRVTIDTTFETAVPTPVITIEPAFIDLAGITHETIIPMKISNHGLIAAEQSKLVFGQHPLWRITPLIEDVGTLPAMSSITIPVRIEPLFPAPPAPGLAGAAAPAPVISIPCILEAGLNWSLVCGPDRRWYRVPIPFINFGGNCGRPGPGGGGGGGGGGSGTSGNPTVTTSTTKSDTPCLKCDTDTFKKTCDKGELGFELASVKEDILDLINKAFPPYFQIMDAGISFNLAGELCDCCVDGKLGRSGSVSAGIEANVEAGLGFFLPDDLLEWEFSGFGYDEIEIEIEGFAGVKFDCGGQGEVKLDWKCHEIFPELCGSFNLGCEIGPTIEVSGKVEAEVGGTQWSGMITGTVKVTTRVQVQWDGCENFKGKACYTDVVAVLEVEGELTSTTGQTRSITWSRSKTLLPGNCDAPAPPAPPQGMYGPVPPPPPQPYQFTRDKQRYLGPLGRFEGLTIAQQLGQLPPPGGGAVCSQVKLRLEQDAVLTRDAFRATLELTNKSGAAIDNVGVTLFIRSADGTLVPQFFGVRLESLTELTNVNGTGTLGNERVGTAKWILIPTNDAAPLEPLQYFVGGTLSYRADGLDVAIPLADVPITVLPNPRLTLKYFHQRDVFSDDPFTPLVEPAIPYSLGIMVINNGAGFAHNFRVTSGQPTIIENEKGLLADFRIIATQVNGQPLQPSLTANFGDIGPGAIAIGEWLFTSSIQGLFIDYSATFEHLDALDGVRLSLIEATEIYEMIHKVRALGALDDGAPDFLVNQVDDPRDLPDTIHLSDGTTAPVAVVEAAQVSGATVKTLTATLPVGWAYLRIPDPGNGQLRLRSVTRSDGLVLPLDVNAWTTDRTFLGQGQRPIYENILHLLDHDSTGSYTLDYEPLLPGDVLAPVSQVQPLGADSPREFAVTWTGTDDRGIAHFDIYVSIDGGAYSLWQERTRESGALFNGETGRTYAFYSRATDFAGNTEAAPALADATTRTTIANLAPTLAAIGDRQVNEGETLLIDVSANDADGRADLLTFAFAAPVPPGLVIDNRTGRMRWVTGEADGGRQVSVQVRVTDAGAPAQSATRSFGIAVQETNQPPAWQEAPAPSVIPGNFLTIQLRAQDGDLPAQTLTYRFATPPPSGMTISAATGVISWQPTLADADRSIAVTVAVRDSGSPAAEATLTFPVIVGPAQLDRPPQFYATPGQIWLTETVRTLQINAFDPDGDAVRLTLNGATLPAGVTFSSTEGSGLATLTWNTTGAAPGLYPVPVKAAARALEAAYAPVVKIVKNNPYWSWAAERFKSVSDLNLSDPTADPDGDQRANIHEWALLRDAMVPDEAPLAFTLSGPHDGWYAANFSIYRQRGSNQFVTLLPQFNSDLASPSWLDIPSPEWEVFLDPAGDRDGNPETEEVSFRVWLNFDDPLPKRFFRLKSTVRNPLP